jgi:hypothetical protein
MDTKLCHGIAGRRTRYNAAIMGTKIREIAEKHGATVAFIPNSPQRKFHSPGMNGHLHVLSLSFTEEEDGAWVRGWQFTMLDGEGTQVDSRYMDQTEIQQLALLLKKWSDESVSLGFEYRSIEGVVFKKFERNQRVTMSSPGGGQITGLQGEHLVEQVFEFMQSSSKLWE